MSDIGSLAPGYWTDGPLLPNIQAGQNTIITGNVAFKRFHSLQDSALTIGAHCTMDGVHFAFGEGAHAFIGDYCYFTNTILLCELELQIGSYVMIGWNTTISDSDFHPISPAERIADAIACSPLGKGRLRPEVAKRRIVIDDDVWIGPNATILKGVHIGAGSFVEAGALITRDVPPGVRVAGNPAQIIGEL